MEDVTNLVEFQQYLHLVANTRGYQLSNICILKVHSIIEI